MQLSFRNALNPSEIERKKSLGGAIDLCASVAGYELDKQLTAALGVDKGQFSRWSNGSEGIKWASLTKLMDYCGNDAPLLWMNYDRGYDLHSMRQRENELERKYREAREENAALRRVLIGQGTL